MNRFSLKIIELDRKSSSAAARNTKMLAGHRKHVRNTRQSLAFVCCEDWSFIALESVSSTQGSPTLRNKVNEDVGDLKIYRQGHEF